MNSISINKIYSLTEKYKIVELIHDWINDYILLARLIREIYFKSTVYMVVYNNNKFCDTSELYSKIQSMIDDLDELYVFTESNLESLIYHLYMLKKIKRGYLILILPYMRDLRSQIEISYFKKLVSALHYVVESGWRVLIINPVVNNHRNGGVFIANITLKIENSEEHSRFLVVDVKEDTFIPILKIV